MKRVLFLMIGAMLIINGCNTGNSKKGLQLAGGLSATDTNLISRDTANKMINSYLNSINYSVNDTDVKSFIINVATLKNFLDSEQNITQFKIFFAHTLRFINSGHANQYAGYSSNALTIIIAGVDSNGDYVYYPGTTVIDNSAHCPSNCPPGSAGNNTLTLPSNRP